jgi:hypothetical protein
MFTELLSRLGDPQQLDAVGAAGSAQCILHTSCDLLRFCVMMQ